MNKHLPVMGSPEGYPYGFGTEVMRQIKICTLCKAPCEAGRKRCPKCKAALPKDTLYETYKKRNRCCPDCGTVILVGADYCPKCGKSLEYI